MELENVYRWEAEKADGSIITSGADLTDCIRVSLIPQFKHSVPRHDFVGIPFKRRFARGFHKIKFHERNEIPGGLKWVNGSPIVETITNINLTAILQPGYYIRQAGPVELCPWYKIVEIIDNKICLEKPFVGETSANCPSLFYIPTINTEYLHCIVCERFRIYVKSSNGTVLITPENYEVYL